MMEAEKSTYPAYEYLHMRGLSPTLGKECNKNKRNCIIVSFFFIAVVLYVVKREKLFTTCCDVVGYASFLVEVLTSINVFT